MEGGGGKKNQGTNRTNDSRDEERRGGTATSTFRRGPGWDHNRKPEPHGGKKGGGTWKKVGK